jgi:dienelactone hydrolase
MPILSIDTSDGVIDLPFAPAPTGADGAAVLLLPAIAGVNDYIRRVSKRLNDVGYAVLTLDYYAREGAPPDVTTPDRIGAAVAALSDARVISDAALAFDALRRQPHIDAERVGALGFCIGGMYAFLAGCEPWAPKASVDYYGAVRYDRLTPEKPHSPLDKILELRSPLLGHFGTYDRLIAAADIDEFEHELQAAGKSYELFRYRGAPHAFDEDFRPAVFRPVAAQLAWHRTIAFLEWHLHGIALR